MMDRDSLLHVSMGAFNEDLDDDPDLFGVVMDWLIQDMEVKIIHRRIEQGG